MKTININSKKIVIRFLVILLLIVIYNNTLAQLNYEYWTTVGGQSNRDGQFNVINVPMGLSNIFNMQNSVWGMQIFTGFYGFATTRYTSISPLRAIVEYKTYGNSVSWSYESNDGVFVIMGFRNDKIYVRNFKQSGSDSIFALTVGISSTPTVAWRSPHTVERGIIWTAAFASNGDLIIPGSGTKRIMRINHTNGDTVWTNSRIIPNTGAECICVNGNTVYAWDGGLTTPKTIIAIDATTGLLKYKSQTLPGDGDQEIPFSVSKSGIVYAIRDGGLLYALHDTGSGFNLLWSRPVVHPIGTYSQIGINFDSTIYIPSGRKILRLNSVTGATIDSSADLVNTGNINPRFAFTRNKDVYIGNGASTPSEGKYFKFTSNLRTILWSDESPYNYYCGPTMGFGFTNPHGGTGGILYTGQGTEVKYKYDFVTNVEPNGISEIRNFKLNQNYPNPFNPETKISFSIYEAGLTRLEIFNSQGKLVRTLINQFLNPGDFNFRFNGIGLTSGVYFYRLISGLREETKSMLLIK